MHRRHGAEAATSTDADDEEDADAMTMNIDAEEAAEAPAGRATPRPRHRWRRHADGAAGAGAVHRPRDARVGGRVPRSAARPAPGSVPLAGRPSGAVTRRPPRSSASR